MQKLLISIQQNISIYAIFNDQSFNDTLTNDIISFEQLGPGSLRHGSKRIVISSTERKISVTPIEIYKELLAFCAQVTI